LEPDQIFSIVNMVALIGWLALAVMPGRRVITDVVCRLAVPGLFAAIYIAIVAANLRQSSGSFSTLPGVAALFSNPWLLLAGWIHYLAFDLFVGTWEVRDSRERRIPYWLVLPCLALTFLFGPAGLLLYVLIRLTIPALRRRAAAAP
jgi:hypothetical protein